MRRIAIASFAFLGAALFVPAEADDLTGAEKFLCSATSASTCCDDGQCATGPVAELGLPQFVEIDLAAKRISTTKASGLNRTTVVDEVKRANGLIVLLGFDNGRGFSYVIKEKTGYVSAAVAGAECGVVAYGSCTPLPASK